MDLKIEKFKIACRAYFPNCKFSDVDENDVILFMSKEEYAPKKRVWAQMYIRNPVRKSNKKPGKPVTLDTPFYKLVYETDELSYATRQVHFITDNLDEFTQKLNGLKRVDD